MIFVNKDIILLNKEYCGDVAFVMKKSPSENGREYMPYEEIKGIVIAVFVLAVVGPFVGDIISRHSKHRKPEKPIPKGRIWQSNDGSLPILTIAVRLVEKQEQAELEEEEALQRAIEAVLAQNKRDYRQDIKTGRI